MLLVAGFVVALAAVFSPGGDDAASPPEQPEPAALSGQASVTTEEQPVPLETLVPGFAGRLHVVTRTGGPYLDLFTWEAGDPAPTVRPLPTGLHSSSLAWSADRSRLAGLGGGVGGNVLYAGRPGRVVPVALGVDSFAWHATDPQRIAWTEPQPTGRSLVTARLTRTGVAAATLAQVEGALVTWGDWGLALEHFDGGSRLVTLDALGAPHAEAAVTVNSVLNTDYVLQLDSAPGGGAAVFDVVEGRETDLGVPAGAFLVLVSPTGHEAMWVTQPAARRALLETHLLDEAAVAEEYAIPPAHILDRDPGGKYVLLQSLVSCIDEDSVFRPLLVLDRATDEVHVVPFARAGIVSAAIQAEGPAAEGS